MSLEWYGLLALLILAVSLFLLWWDRPGKPDNRPVLRPRYLNGCGAAAHNFHDHVCRCTRPEGCNGIYHVCTCAAAWTTEPREKEQN